MNEWPRWVATLLWRFSLVLGETPTICMSLVCDYVARLGAQAATPVGPHWLDAWRTDWLTSWKNLTSPWIIRNGAASWHSQRILASCVQNGNWEPSTLALSIERTMTRWWKSNCPWRFSLVLGETPTICMSLVYGYVARLGAQAATPVGPHWLYAWWTNWLTSWKKLTSPWFIPNGAASWHSQRIPTSCVQNNNWEPSTPALSIDKTMTRWWKSNCPKRRKRKKRSSLMERNTFLYVVGIVPLNVSTKSLGNSLCHKECW